MTVMKIYRRSIKKSTSMYTLKPIVVILALFLLMTIGNLKGFLVFLVIELCVLSFIVACTATQLFYVVLTENSLIVNSILLKKLKSAIRADYRGLIFR